MLDYQKGHGKCFIYYSKAFACVDGYEMPWRWQEY